MSDFWTGEALAGAARISPFVPAALGAFTPWGRQARGPAAEAPMPTDDEDDGQVIDPSAIHAQGFAEGHAEGLRMLERAILDERAAVTALADSLAALRPEPAGPLAALLAETVERLVRQVVGEVEVDRARLLERASAAAELIADDAAPARMRLHPDDVERLAGTALPVELIADPAIAPGAVLVEGEQGWIEDGPAAALERLRHVLNQMGVA